MQTIKQFPLDVGDRFTLYACQVHGAYMDQNLGWCPHKNMSGPYEVVEEDGHEVILLKLDSPNRLRFRCAAAQLRAILTDEWSEYKKGICSAIHTNDTSFG